jgi:2-oxoglutarate dehydrogenase E2 component (dihydrolipoamide succinyltransferase)
MANTNQRGFFMKVEIKIPAMGESISEAIVSNILKPNGSFVKEDEEILELETEKVNQLLPAPKTGILHLSVSLQDKVTIGQVIGFIDTEAKAPEEAPRPAAPAAAPVREAPQKPEKKVERAAPAGPSARHMAPEFIEEIKKPAAPSREAEAPKAAAAPKIAEHTGGISRKKMSSLRKTIAERLVAAKNQTAMLTTFNEVDMTAIMGIREKEKESFLARYGVKLGFMSFFVKAVVAALKSFPDVNGKIEGDEILLYNSYDIGIAVGTEKGLLVPVIRGCDALSFGQIEAAIAAFAQKARKGSISIEDLRGGSFTITNGGVYGSLLSTPILNPPQSAILGMHKIMKRAVVIDDKIVARPMMYLALSYDHRIIDGRESVQFLGHLKESLEDPARLLLDL